MKRTLLGVACVAALTLALTATWHKCYGEMQSTDSRQGRAVTPADRRAALDAYGKLPMSFEENVGQTDGRVRFLSHGAGYTVFLTEDAATLQIEPASARQSNPFTRVKDTAASRSDHDKIPGTVLRFELAGANSHPTAHGVDVLPGHSNYFVGNNPASWHRGVSQFSRVQFDGVYPGIDLAYYGSQGRLESDYIVAPGADAQQIAVRVEGADRVKVESNGEAIVTSAVLEVPLHQPVAYQEIDGTRRLVAASYVQRGPNLVGIRVGAYDPKQTLIIDPVVGYGTFLSGATGATFANGIAVDSTGDAVIVGSTSATDFPVTAGVFQNASKATTNPTGYVSKLNGAGTALLFSTYLGGSGSSARGDVVSSVALDASGDVLVVGTTGSTDFPFTSSGLQITNKNNFSSGFLSKLDPTGATLLYSTYLGGSVGDNSTSVALDSNGNAYVTGFTSSNDFPTTPATAIQTATKTGNPTAYVIRIDTTKSGTSSLIYSTLLGGSNGEIGNGIAVDGSFHAYITGTTKSPDFPVTTTSAFQTTIKGTTGNAFVSEIDTTTPSNLMYSTFLGGTATTRQGDSGAGIALDNSFNAYVIGTDVSPDFPTTAGAFQTTPPNNFLTVFVARLDTTKIKANSLIYSTFLGGSNGDIPGGITVDPAGNAYLTGSTQSNNFPTTPGAPQTTHTGPNDNPFVSVLDPTGSTLKFSTFYGGNNGDFGDAIAIDSATVPNVYFTGLTASANFPVTPNGFQTTFKTGGPYVVKLSPGAATGVVLSPPTIDFGNQIVGTSSADLTATLANLSPNTISISGVSITGTDAGDFHQSSSTCTGSIPPNGTCIVKISFAPTKAAPETATLTLTYNDPSSPQSIALSGTGTPAPTPVFITPSTLAFGNQAINTTSAAQTVTLVNSSATPVNGIAVSLTGTTPSAYAETTTCGNSLAAGASCTISVTFKPTAAGGTPANLTVAASDTNSPHVAALFGTGITTAPDFTIVANPSSATVAPGGSASIAVTVAGVNGFTTPVALTCTGAPTGSSCILSPTSVTPTASGANASAAISTTAPPAGTAIVLRLDRRTPFGGLFGALALLFFVFAAWFARRVDNRRKLAWTFAALLAVSVSGCSGLPHTGTPAGTYTLTITGTAGSLTHKATVTLTVS